MSGSVSFEVMLGNAATPADEADVGSAIRITDVRLNPNLNDYTGQLQASITLRITDRLSGPSANEVGTITDIPFNVTIPCAATSSSTIGATCSLEHDRRCGAAGHGHRDQAHDLADRRRADLRRRAPTGRRPRRTTRCSCVKACSYPGQRAAAAPRSDDDPHHHPRSASGSRFRRAARRRARHARGRRGAAGLDAGRARLGDRRRRPRGGGRGNP